MARPPIIALKDVRLADGPRMLFDGVDLALEPGVRACLVGRNGAGKSTLLRMLVGLTQPDGGDRTLTPAAKISLVAQEPDVAGETLLAYASAGGATAHEAEAALQAFSLDPRRTATSLSGGEQRRAALARAFAEKPEVLLLDEPTNHRQPRPRLPRARNPALLLARGPADLAAGQGLCRLRRLVRAHRRRPGGVAASAQQIDRARDLHLLSFDHRPAQPQRGARAAAGGDA
jgi:ATPase subunit of ABC transporter with duplicated ATPase domains